MNISILQHMSHEGPGSIADWATERGHQHQTHHLYQDDAPPTVGDFDLLVVLGGDMSVHDQADHPWLAPERELIRAALSAGKPVVGICLGAQQIAYALDAAVYPNDQREVGFWPIRKIADTLPLPDELDVLHWHGDTFDLPPDARLFASSEGCRNQMFLAANGLALGLQCHIETTAEMVDDFCRDDAAYLSPPPGHGRWMQSAAAMRAETQSYAAMRSALFALLDSFTQPR
ncbi:MAG TPA: type 1 glutamine amidotransferase [bacterium]|nr:type 1 glutamine amidotransferase [bacterium]